MSEAFSIHTLHEVAVDVEAEDVRGVLADGIDIGGEFHAARFAAATGVDSA